MFPDFAAILNTECTNPCNGFIKMSLRGRLDRVIHCHFNSVTPVLIIPHQSLWLRYIFVFGVSATWIPTSTKKPTSAEIGCLFSDILQSFQGKDRFLLFV